MSDPTRGGFVRKKRSTQADTTAPVMSQEDSLAIEAYGNRGAALRKSLKAVGESQADSTMLQKGVARVKRFFSSDDKED